MKVVRVLNHPDGVSGTSIFDDGQRAHWTEGRNSSVVFSEHGPNPDGTGGAVINRLWNGLDTDPTLDAIDNAENPEIRDMTEAEATDWQTARDCAAQAD